MNDEILPSTINDNRLATGSRVRAGSIHVQGERETFPDQIANAKFWEEDKCQNYSYKCSKLIIKDIPICPSND